MNYTFDWTTDSEYAALQSHKWFCKDNTWWGEPRVHWDRCNPLCGCEQMSIKDIVYLLPHHRYYPPRRYVLQFPVDLTRHAKPQPNSLANIAVYIVHQQLSHFFSHANYPFWHFSDFTHAQMVLKNDYNLPPGVSYFLLPPLDHFMCWCYASPNETVTNPLDSTDRHYSPAPPEPLRE